MVSGITVDTSQGADTFDVANGYDVGLSTDGTDLHDRRDVRVQRRADGGHQLQGDDWRATSATRTRAAPGTERPDELVRHPRAQHSLQLTARERNSARRSVTSKRPLPSVHALVAERGDPPRIVTASATVRACVVPLRSPSRSRRARSR